MVILVIKRNFIIMDRVNNIEFMGDIKGVNILYVMMYLVVYIIVC